MENFFIYTASASVLSVRISNALLVSEDQRSDSAIFISMATSLFRSLATMSLL